MTQKILLRLFEVRQVLSKAQPYEATYSRRGCCRLAQHLVITRLRCLIRDLNRVYTILKDMYAGGGGRVPKIHITRMYMVPAVLPCVECWKAISIYCCVALEGRQNTRELPQAACIIPRSPASTKCYREANHKHSILKKNMPRTCIPRAFYTFTRSRTLSPYKSMLHAIL